MLSGSKLRILHVLNHVRESGNGIVNATVDLACTQAKLGYSVAVASGGGDYQDLLARHHVEHFQFDQRRSPGDCLTLLPRYAKIIQTFKPDIVHAHMMTGVLAAWSYQQLQGLLGDRPYRTVATVHNEFQRNATLMGLADRALGVSQAVVDAMQKRGVPAEKLQVVLNGTLNSPRQSTAAERQLPTLGQPAILTVAGMYRRKGITELIAAFDAIAGQATDAQLYVVGNGPDLAEFKQQASASAFGDRIHFEGFQPNPQDYMAQADIFVLASHREPFGLVLSEARAAGCAIVASDVDGIPEALDRGKAGILVPPKDPQALASTLLGLLQNPQQVAEYQKRARTNLERFTVERVAKETISIYADLLSQERLTGMAIARG